MCYLCEAARRVNNPFTDPSLDASWRSTCVNHLGFLQRQIADGKPISRIFGLIGFRIESISLDWMHLADLGVTSIALGNCLWEMFETLGRTPTKATDTLKQLSQYLKSAAQDIGATWPYSSLRMERFRSKDGWRFRLRSKAADCRTCLPIVLECLRSFFPATTQRERLRENCIHKLYECYSELYSWSIGSAQRLSEKYRRHCTLFLDVDSPSGWTHWRWVPKHHLLLHLTAEQCEKVGNPRSFWNYRDEHEIGVAASLAESSHIKTLPSTSLQKYKVWKHFK